MLTKRNLLVAFMIAVLIVGAGLTGVCMTRGLSGFNLMSRRGGTFWTNIDPASRRTSGGMRLALSENPPPGQAGDFSWQLVSPGFEVGELPVLVDGEEVDRILLTRIDPARFRFVVRNAQTGDNGLQEWMTKLGAVAVINGSYYNHDGTPNTPLVSDGVLMGPSSYNATHGAFVVSSSGVEIRDLAHADWRIALRGADDAMVSYPMLVSGIPEEHVIKPTRWLANRSFVGVDESGKVILGTTKDAFFSLARLGAFLRTAPLGLTSALNLDGGPVACQGVSVGDYRRDFCGRWETRENGGQLKLLHWPFGRALPIVLAAVPK